MVLLRDSVFSMFYRHYIINHFFRITYERITKSIQFYPYFYVYTSQNIYLKVNLTNDRLTIMTYKSKFYLGR